MSLERSAFRGWGEYPGKSPLPQQRSWVVSAHSHESTTPTTKLSRSLSASKGSSRGQHEPVLSQSWGLRSYTNKPFGHVIGSQSSSALQDGDLTSSFASSVPKEPRYGRDTTYSSAEVQVLRRLLDRESTQARQAKEILGDVAARLEEEGQHHAQTRDRLLHLVFVAQQRAQKQLYFRMWTLFAVWVWGASGKP